MRTSKQNSYLQERGFEIVTGNPNESEPFPYVRLKTERGLGGLDATFEYCIGFGGPCAPAHPNFFKTDELVEMVEDTVSRFMIHDSSCGGSHFRTSPGTPIKIFMEDDAWQAVAEALVAKYR